MQLWWATHASLTNSHREVEAAKYQACQTVFWPVVNSTLLPPSPPVSRASYYAPHSSRNRSKMATSPYGLQVGLCRFFSQVAGMLFLVMMDRLSNWPTIIPCQSDTIASSTICCFCAIFREVGVSLWLCTDGGPP